MIIGIDVSAVAYGTGVSNYTLNLVSGLISQDRSNTYKLFFSSMRLPVPSDIIQLSKKYSNVQLYAFKLAPTLLHWLWNKLHLIPIEFFIGKCDVFHTSDWTQPPTLKAKLVTTVHDLTPFTHPQWHHPKVISTHTAKMKLAIKESSAIICVSQNTKSDFQKLFPRYKGLVEVIYEAAEDKYSRFRSLSSPTKSQKISQIKKTYNLNNYILAQGTREPRKNLGRLIEAFKLYKQNNPKSTLELAIAGKYGWGQDIDHNLFPYIKILGYIPEKDMVPLHAGAFALAYTSLYEGFGLPVVKAFSLGIPLLTSNNSSLSEIASDAAILVDAESVESIFQGLQKIINSTATRQSVVKKGLIRAKLFSWKITSKQTLKTYSKLIC